MANFGIEPVGATLLVGSQSFCAITIAGVGVDGGEPIDITTLCNDTWMTKQAPKLKDVPNLSFTTLYDAEDWEAVRDIVNVNSLCTLTFEDVGTFTWFGYIRNLNSDPKGKGEVLEASFEIVCTNVDPSDLSEEGPSFTEA